MLLLKRIYRKKNHHIEILCILFEWLVILDFTKHFSLMNFEKRTLWVEENEPCQTHSLSCYTLNGDGDRRLYHKICIYSINTQFNQALRAESINMSPKAHKVFTEFARTVFKIQSFVLVHVLIGETKATTFTFLIFNFSDLVL